jgi:hypothetical protein
MSADRTERSDGSLAYRGVLVVVVWREGTSPGAFRARLRWATDVPSANEGTTVVRSVRDALATVRRFLEGWSTSPRGDTVDGDAPVTPSSRNCHHYPGMRG